MTVPTHQRQRSGYPADASYTAHSTLSKHDPHHYSHSPIPSSPILLSGSLWKLGGQVKEFKQRYLVIRSDATVEYYRRQSEFEKYERQAMLGSFSLQGAMICRLPTTNIYQQQHALCITPAYTKRQFVLASRDENTATLWTKTMLNLAQGTASPTAGGKNIISTATSAISSAPTAALPGYIHHSDVQRYTHNDSSVTQHACATNECQDGQWYKYYMALSDQKQLLLFRSKQELTQTPILKLALNAHVTVQCEADSYAPVAATANDNSLKPPVDFAFSPEMSPIFSTSDSATPNANSSAGTQQRQHFVFTVSVPLNASRMTLNSLSINNNTTTSTAPRYRIYIFRCSTTAERDRWVSYIADVIQQCTRIGIESTKTSLDDIEVADSTSDSKQNEQINQRIVATTYGAGIDVASPGRTSSPELLVDSSSDDDGSEAESDLSIDSMVDEADEVSVTDENRQQASTLSPASRSRRATLPINSVQQPLRLHTGNMNRRSDGGFDFKEQSQQYESFSPRKSLNHMHDLSNHRVARPSIPSSNRTSLSSNNTNQPSPHLTLAHNNSNSITQATNSQSKSVRFASITKEQSYDETKKTTLKTGTLYKYDSKQPLSAPTAWKQRHYVLKGFTLLSYLSNDSHLPISELHLIGTHAQPESFNEYKSIPYCFSVLQTQAKRQLHVFRAGSREEMDDWLYVIKLRHTFSGIPMPLRLNPKHHKLSMHLNPHDTMLAALAAATAANDQTSTDTQQKSKLLIKSRVSKKKRRFVADGFDLDLAYITDRIVAMGFPATGTEAIYRNDMQQVQKFLDTRHPQHYKIYNLCSERKYDHSHFADRVFEFPFDDHNTPSFQDLSYFCKDVADYLSAHEDNIVVIHCKAGKGRTGLMISVFLLYLGIHRDARSVLEYYAMVRTLNAKGVTIASQIRWVHMWEKYLTLSRDGLSLQPPVKLVLKRMLFGRNAPAWSYFETGCHGIYVDSRNNVAANQVAGQQPPPDNSTHSSSPQPPKSQHQLMSYTTYRHPEDGSTELIFDTLQHPVVFLTDFQVDFYKDKLFGSPKRVFSWWLHTQFIDYTTNYLKLTKMDIDKVCKQKDCPEFTVELWFEPLKAEKLQIDSYGNESATAILIEGRKLTSYVYDRSNARKSLNLQVAQHMPADVKPQDIFLSMAETDEAPLLSWTEVTDADTHTQLPQTMSILDVTAITVGWQQPIWHDYQQQFKPASPTGAHARTRSTFNGRPPTSSPASTSSQLNENLCFSILTTTKSLHLEAASERQLNAMLEGLKHVLKNAGKNLVDDDDDPLSENSNQHQQSPQDAAQTIGLESAKSLRAELSPPLTHSRLASPSYSRASNPSEPRALSPNPARSNSLTVPDEERDRNMSTGTYLSQLEQYAPAGTGRRRVISVVKEQV